MNGKPNNRIGRIGQDNLGDMMKQAKIIDLQQFLFSEKPPDRPGWWFFTDGIVEEVVLVCYVEGQKGKFLAVNAGSWKIPLASITGALWAGPIKRPQNAPLAIPGEGGDGGE